LASAAGLLVCPRFEANGNLIEIMFPSLYEDIIMTTRIARLRARACEEQNALCIYCGYPMLIGDSAAFARRYDITIRQAKQFACTAEHLIACKDGGRTNRENVVAACRLCNVRRHAGRKLRCADQYAAVVRRGVCKGTWHGMRMLRKAPGTAT
jgi:HNH endonuclease